MVAFRVLGCRGWGWLPWPTALDGGSGAGAARRWWVRSVVEARWRGRAAGRAGVDPWWAVPVVGARRIRGQRADPQVRRSGVDGRRIVWRQGSRWTGRRSRVGVEDGWSRGRGVRVTAAHNGPERRSFCVPLAYATGNSPLANRVALFTWCDRLSWWEGNQSGPATVSVLIFGSSVRYGGTIV